MQRTNLGISALTINSAALLAELRTVDTAHITTITPENVGNPKFKRAFGTTTCISLRTLAQRTPSESVTPGSSAPGPDPEKTAPGVAVTETVRRTPRREPRAGTLSPAPRKALRSGGPPSSLLTKSSNNSTASEPASTLGVSMRSLILGRCECRLPGWTSTWGMITIRHATYGDRLM